MEPAMTTSGGETGRTTQVLTVGQLFLDLVYAQMPRPPQPGEEIWTADFGWGPGGVANAAIAAARLGARTAMCAAAGDDALSSLCRARLSDEAVDISGIRTLPGWALPVTASLGYDADRALVTGGTPAPVPVEEIVLDAPDAEVAALDLKVLSLPWARAASARGTRIFADIGWDGSERWDPADLDALDACHAFLPNEVEAMSYTRTDAPLQAARALAERVPLVVVTLGARGAVAVDSATGEEAAMAPVPVRARDATGAGDVFGAAFMVASLTQWPLRERLDFAGLVAAITVSRPGGASTAPGTSDLLPWLDAHPETDRGRFSFLRDPLAQVGRLPFVPTTENSHREHHNHQETRP